MFTATHNPHRIPLERGRELALQFGVEPLIAPLFDFQPNPNMFGPSPLTFAATGLTVPSRPLSASSLTGLQAQANSINGSLAPPPILPGSALRLLNQGRAQGLFTPSTTTLALLAAVTPSHANGTPLTTQELASLGIPDGGENGDFHALKRTHSQRDDVNPLISEPIAPLAEPADIHMLDALQVMTGQMENDEPSLKRQRTESERTPSPINPALIAAITSPNAPLEEPISDSPHPNGLSELNGVEHVNGHPPIISPASYEWRMASKPFAGRGLDTSISLKESRRSSIVAHIMSSDNPAPVLDMMRQDLPENPASPSGIDVDVVLDDQGHTALHIAATMGRLQTVQTLIASGADVHRGNFMGETALVRACLSTQCHDSQVFDRVVEMLNDSIRTVDTSLKSVLHHVVSLAGVKGRELAARYYLDAIFTWIANRQQGDFKSIVDLQDEHGDTALNIAARVGNRGMIKILLDVNANRALANKLGLRPANFGVEVEVSCCLLSLNRTYMNDLESRISEETPVLTTYSPPEPPSRFLPPKLPRLLEVHQSSYFEDAN
jgi:regulatory protein SWI6